MLLCEKHTRHTRSALPSIRGQRLWRSGYDQGGTAGDAPATLRSYRSACSSPHCLWVWVYFQMLSGSRSAAGESRYSAMRAAELALECACIEALGLPALFTLDQGRANCFDLCTALLLSANEITDIFAIVGVVASFDLRLDPVVLLVPAFREQIHRAVLSSSRSSGRTSPAQSFPAARIPPGGFETDLPVAGNYDGRPHARTAQERVSLRKQLSLSIWREHGQPRWDDETGVTDKESVRHRIDRQGVSVEMQVNGVDHVIRISSILVHNR